MASRAKDTVWKVIVDFVGSLNDCTKIKRSLCKSKEAAIRASSIMFNTKQPHWFLALLHFVLSTGSVVFMFRMALLGAVNVRAISIRAETNSSCLTLWELNGT